MNDTEHDGPTGSAQADTTPAHWVIVVNGELPTDLPPGIRRLLLSTDRLVAVDGGLRHCANLDVWPTILIGDLDSAAAELVEQAKERDIAIHTFPADKDATDLELALELALESGATGVTVVAAFGGRLDHELATISLLAADRWRSMTIAATDGARHVHVVHHRRTLHLDAGATVSLIPWHGHAAGVTTQGLQWPLHDATLPAGTTQGVSNVVVDSTQKIAVNTGVLLVVVDPTT